mgnify:FL=1
MRDRLSFTLRDGGGGSFANKLYREMIENTLPNTRWTRLDSVQADHTSLHGYNRNRHTVFGNYYKSGEVMNTGSHTVRGLRSQYPRC